MEIRVDARVGYPVEDVFATYRDGIMQLIPFLPNIRGIEVKSRIEKGRDVELENDWIGGGDIPAVVRSVLSESMLKWTDFALWRADSLEVEWRTHVHAFPDAVKSAGKNRFVKDGDVTRIEFRGDLTVDARKVKGVPRLLAGTVAETAEKIIVASVGTNLRSVAKGVESLIESRRGGPR
jgi:hypothetical protein